MNEGDVFCGLTAENLELAATSVCRWPSSDITYSFRAYLAALGKETQRALTKAAFEVIPKFCGLVATETTDADGANILLSAGRGRRVGFDGPSGILAFCELPCGSNPQQCDLVYDLDEAWLADNTISGGILYFNVCLHELIHGLGVPHGPAGNIMAPTYQRNLNSLGPWDIAELQRRYGPPRITPPDEPPGTATLVDVRSLRLFAGSKDITNLLGT